MIQTTFTSILFDAFSLQKTLKKLVKPNKYDSDDGELEIFNMLKVYTIAVIVLGNTFLLVLDGPLRNLEMS